MFASPSFFKKKNQQNEKTTPKSNQPNKKSHQQKILNKSDNKIFYNNPSPHFCLKCIRKRKICSLLFIIVTLSHLTQKSPSISCQLSASISRWINRSFYQFLLLKPVFKNSVYLAPYWPLNAPFPFLLCKSTMNLT